MRDAAAHGVCGSGWSMARLPSRMVARSIGRAGLSVGDGWAVRSGEGGADAVPAGGHRVGPSRRARAAAVRPVPPRRRSPADPGTPATVAVAGPDEAMPAKPGAGWVPTRARNDHRPGEL